MKFLSKVNEIAHFRFLTTNYIKRKLNPIKDTYLTWYEFKIHLYDNFNVNVEITKLTNPLEFNYKTYEVLIEYNTIEVKKETKFIITNFKVTKK